MRTDEALKNYKKIAVIGYSNNPARPSHGIAKYMKDHGYTVYGVNPGLGGRTINGIDVYNKLSELPEHVEIINVFRRSEALPELIDEILSLDYKPEVIWTQYGVVNEEARNKAKKNGIPYIEDKCIYVEHGRI